MSERVGQFTVPTGAARRRVVAELQRTARRGGRDTVVPTLRQAKVVSDDGGTPPTLTITLNGDDDEPAEIPLVRYLASYTPAAGDVVEVMFRTGNPFVLGTLA